MPIHLHCPHARKLPAALTSTQSTWTKPLTCAYMFTPPTVIKHYPFATRISSNGCPMCSRENQWTAWVKALKKKRAPSPPRGRGVFQRPTVCRHTCGQPHCCMETWTMCLPSRQGVVTITTYTHTLKHMYHPRCQSCLWVLQHPSGTCTQEVENIISLGEQSRDSTIQKKLRKQ